VRMGRIGSGWGLEYCCLVRMVKIGSGWVWSIVVVEMRLDCWDSFLQGIRICIWISG